MRINNIVKFNLEIEARELRWKGKSLEEIAGILSNESGQSVTKSTVFRYFEANDKAISKIVETNDSLQIKIVETEINTIEKRLEIISSLLGIAEQAQACGDLKAAVLALRAATEAQNSLDLRLGKLKPQSNTNINILNIQEAINGAREQFVSAIAAATFGREENEYIESVNR
jgi:intein-encoded DNA endonuclease-like protein